MPPRVTDTLFDRYLAFNREMALGEWTAERYAQVLGEAGLNADELRTMQELVCDVLDAGLPRPLDETQRAEVQAKLAPRFALGSAASALLAAWLERVGVAEVGEKLGALASIARARVLASKLERVQEVEQQGEKELALNAAAIKWGAENVELVLRRLPELLAPAS